MTDTLNEVDTTNSDYPHPAVPTQAVPTCATQKESDARPTPSAYPNVYRLDAAGKPAEWIGFFLDDEAAKEWTTKHKKEGPFVINHDPRPTATTESKKEKS